jgi:hypothetical protein
MSDLANQTPASTYKGLLQVGDYTDGVDSTVKAVLDGEGTASALAIGTTKVGVGTTSPSVELEVNGQILATGSIVGVSNGGSATGVGMYSPASNQMGLCTNSTEAMRIDSSGKVGIGTASPDFNLSVVSDTDPAKIGIHGYGSFSDGTVAAQLYFVGKDSDGGNRNLAHIQVREHDHTLGSGSMEFVTRISGIEDARMTINEDGNVGIGTEDPGAKLDIDGTLLFSTSSTSSAWMLETGVDTLSIKEKTGNSFTSRVSFQDGGNVGIGTVSPSAPLEVASTTGGVIMPRMTTTQMNAISSPTDGEMIYNTTENKFYGRANGAWTALH